MSIFNLFKCKHKRKYEVTTKLDDGSLVVNTYCRKCEKAVGFYTYGIGRIETTSANDNKETYKGEDIAKLRHQGMLLEKVPENLTKGTYMFDGKGDLIKIGDLL